MRKTLLQQCTVSICFLYRGGSAMHSIDSSYIGLLSQIMPYRKLTRCHCGLPCLQLGDNSIIHLHNNVSLLGHISKLVSILLSKLVIVPIMTQSYM